MGEIVLFSAPFGVKSNLFPVDNVVKRKRNKKRVGVVEGILYEGEINVNTGLCKPPLLQPYPPRKINLFHEISVMTHYDQRPLEILERLLERLEHFEV